MALLDAAGALLPPAYELWYDPNASEEDKEKERSRRRRPTSPAASQEGGVAEGQYAVVCLEKQATVVAMPSQTAVFKHNITESSFVLRADVVQMAATNCIACFCANGHIMTLRYPPNTLPPNTLTPNTLPPKHITPWVCQHHGPPRVSTKCLRVLFGH